MQLFQQLEEDGVSLDLPWDKVTPLFNLARLLEQLYRTETASILYRLIIYKVGINAYSILYHSAYLCLLNGDRVDLY